MIRQIMIEAERPDDAQSMFRLSIDANLIAKGVTVAQAHYLVGEVLGGFGLPRHPGGGDVRRSTGRQIRAEVDGEVPPLTVEKLSQRR